MLFYISVTYDIFFIVIFFIKLFPYSSISSVFNNFEIKKQAIPPPSLPDQPLETQTNTPNNQKKKSSLLKIMNQRKSISFSKERTRRNSKSHSNKLDVHQKKEDYNKKGVFEKG